MEYYIVLLVFYAITLIFLRLVFAEIEGRQARKMSNVRYFLRYHSKFVYRNQFSIIFVAFLCYMIVSVEKAFSTMWFLQLLGFIAVGVISDALSQIVYYYYINFRFKKDIVESEELKKLSHYLDYRSVETLIEKIKDNEGNIFVSGCGTSAMAAKKIVHTFQVINQKAFYVNPSDAVHGGLGVVDKNDIFIVISKGGNTNELVSFVGNIKSKGAYLVYVGENESSSICKVADLFLKVKIEKEPDAYNMLATASTLAVISLFDAIAIYLEKNTSFSQEVFLVNHPSGEVGDRLNKNVGK